MIIRVEPLGAGRLRVEGASADDGTIQSVRVNGSSARSLAADFSRWEVTLDLVEGHPTVLTAIAQDRAGNVEATPHVLDLATPPQLPTQQPARAHDSPRSDDSSRGRHP